MVLTNQNGHVVCFGKVTSNELNFPGTNPEICGMRNRGLIQVWPAMDKILH